MNFANPPVISCPLQVRDHTSSVSRGSNPRLTPRCSTRRAQLLPRRDETAAVLGRIELLQKPVLQLRPLRLVHIALEYRLLDALPVALARLGNPLKAPAAWHIDGRHVIAHDDKHCRSLFGTFGLLRRAIATGRRGTGTRNRLRKLPLANNRA